MLNTTHPFSALLGHRPSRLPNMPSSTLVVQGKVIEKGRRLTLPQASPILEGEDDEERRQELDAIKAERRKIADRARHRRYNQKPEVKAKVKAREAEKKEAYRKTRRAWVERNAEKLRAYRREQQRRYRADPAKAEGINAKARERQRIKRAQLKQDLTPDQLEQRRQKQREYQAKWRAKNRESIRAYARVWKDKRRELESNRSADTPDTNTSGATRGTQHGTHE